MSDLTPKFKVYADEARGEMFFSLSGYFHMEDIKAFMREANKRAAPLVEKGKTVHLLGDLEGFVPQSRDVAERLRIHLDASRELGLQRIAIINGSPLASLQYKRVSRGIDIEFFEVQADALAWLRRVE